MPLFDTHTHIYLSQEKTEKEIIQSIKDNPELTYITSIAVDLETSSHNLELAKRYDFIIPTVWIHPCYVESFKDTMEETFSKLEKYLKTEKVFAVGECGLDYYRLPPRLEETTLEKEELIKLQKLFFREQIHLAKKYQLPLIIHNREAKEDTINILRQEDFKNFVFHCYSEDLEFAKDILHFAPWAMISFSGIVTFNSAKTLQEVAKNIPLGNILIETDCPYLSPAPERGTENYPEKVKYVLKKIQELRDEPADKIEQQIYENSLHFFRI